MSLVVAAASGWTLPSTASSAAANGPHLVAHAAGGPTGQGEPGGEVCIADPTTGNCIVDASPAVGVAAIGTSTTVTFVCDTGAAYLTGPAGQGYPTTGCFNVGASVTDATAGATSSFSSATCAGVSVPTYSGSVSCGPMVNPICAVGYSLSGGLCQPCPPGMSLSGSICIVAPTGNTCPPGTTPVKNSGGGIISCTAPELSASTPSSANEVQLTLNMASPHLYLVQIAGFVGTYPNGSCPPSTTFTPNVLLLSGPGGPFSGPACAFSLTTTVRYLEATHLSVGSSDCGGTVQPGQYFQQVGQGCLVNIQATGTIVLKLNVNCSDGSEPATGTSAAPVGFGPNSTYDCANNALSVVNVPVPNAPLDLQAMNGIFNPTCFPLYQVPGATPTPTPTATSPGATITPTAVPPTPRPPGYGPAYCGPPGQSSLQVSTDANGQVGIYGNQAEYTASAQPYNPPTTGMVNVLGQFSIDNRPYPGVATYVHFIFANGVEAFCGPVYTNGTGSAQCTQKAGLGPSGVTALADVDFIL
ncbi:MAG TPA: hypothetical protein VKX16_13140, partial [Chloroflexota bacterium]|nr:hypothetical protein [Chloroflexota bacterium]